MKSARRVFITGIGAMTLLGHNIATTWDAILKGKSGIDYLPEFDVKSGPSISEFKVHIGGAIKKYNPNDYLNPNN